MNSSIPPQIAEAVNGTLLALFVISAVFYVLYLIRAWRDRDCGMSASFYSYENKTAIGLATSAIGMSIKTWAAWWALHLHNHGLKPNFPILTPTIIIGTIIAAWGLICVLRAVSRFAWPRYAWAWLAVGSVAFGALFAM